jgi:hypothetical protein
MTKPSNARGGRNVKTTTIDLIHNKKMKEFQKDERTLPKLHKRVNELLKLINGFEMLNNMGDCTGLQKIVKPTPKKGRNKKKTVSEEKIITSFDEYYTCLDEKGKLDVKIDELENSTKKTDYFMGVGDLLFQYYDDKKNLQISKSSQIAPKSKKKNSILNYFAKKREQQTIKKANTQLQKSTNENAQLDQPPNTDPTSPSTSIEQQEERTMYKGNMKYLGKGNVITQYMRTVDPDYVVPLEYDELHDYCDDCKCYMKIIHSEGVMRCGTCGYQEDILIDSDKPSYKDPPRELSFYNYKKMNHMIELTKSIEISVKYIKYFFKNFLKNVFEFYA